MTIHPGELAARRQALVAKCEQQRALLREAARGVRRGFAWADGTVAILHRVQRKPLAAAIFTVLAGLLIASPGRALKWVSYGLTGYSLFRQLRRIFTQPPQ
ncbi:MAG: hypothetical protein C5B46_01740 [Proteobacteria bacterium]|nr:MAG: hypothetical protein C5B46_01740 [Pseudomonadota bacterium]